MSIDPIAHLDSHASNPFDVIVSLDSTITVMRMAMAEALKDLTYDAVRDNSEQYLSDAMTYLWNAREALVAAVEERSA